MRKRKVEVMLLIFSVREERELKEFMFAEVRKMNNKVSHLVLAPL
jgi:hypothetical protein